MHTLTNSPIIVFLCKKRAPIVNIVILEVKQVQMGKQLKDNSTI